MKLKTQFHSILPDYINFQTEACNIVQQMNIFLFCMVMEEIHFLSHLGYTPFPPCGFRIPTHVGIPY